MLSAPTANFAHASELGFPRSALAEFQRTDPSRADAAEPAPDPAPQQLAKSDEPQQAAKSDEPQQMAKSEEKLDAKTIKYTGKCYARLDGHVRINGPCPVTWRTGDELRVDLDVEDKNSAGVAWRAVVLRNGRKWRARWGHLTDRADRDSNTSGINSRVALQDLGEVRKHGSCWSNSRVRICEQES